MIYYPDQTTSVYYDAYEVAKAVRVADHPEEPSWGLYCLEKWKEEAIDYVMMILADADHDDAQDRIFKHRGTTYVYEGTEED